MTSKTEDIRRLSHPETGEEVAVFYVVQDLEWTEEGLEGVIPDLRLLVVEDTGEVLAFPPETCVKVGEWRRHQIEGRGLTHLKKAQQEREDVMRRLRKHVCDNEKNNANE